jgi:hypothetical protein
MAHSASGTRRYRRPSATFRTSGCVTANSGSRMNAGNFFTCMRSRRRRGTFLDDEAGCGDDVGGAAPVSLTRHVVVCARGPWVETHGYGPVSLTRQGVRQSRLYVSRHTKQRSAGRCPVAPAEGESMGSHCRRRRGAFVSSADLESLIRRIQESQAAGRIPHLRAD